MLLPLLRPDHLAAVDAFALVLSRAAAAAVTALRRCAQDFAQIGSWCPPKEIPTVAIRKLMLEKLNMS